MGALAVVSGWLGDKFTALGLDALARKLGRAAMRMSGVDFFPDRAALERSRSIDEQLASAKDIAAVFIVGNKYREHRLQNGRRLTRLILPHPESEAVKLYAKSGRNHTLQRSIVDTTVDVAALYGTKILWHRQMLHYSIMLGDPKKNDGWAHIECAFPYSSSNLRPSFTVSRKSHEVLVAEMDSMFENLWATAEEPDLATLKKYREGD